MAYGGLRGAVGFSLVTILEDSNPFKEIFQTTTLIMIFITVFIMGSTVKPLVKILNIKKSDKSERMIAEDVNDKCIDLLMAGVESVVGRKMSRYQILNFIVNFDSTYLKKKLIVDGAEDPWTLKLQKISLDEHYARLYGPAIVVAEHKVQDMLGDEGSERPPAASNTENERKALKEGFANSAFSKWNRKTVNSTFYSDESAQALEMENMVNKRTSYLWNVALRNSVPPMLEDVEQAEPSGATNAQLNVGERTKFIKKVYLETKKSLDKND